MPTSMQNDDALLEKRSSIADSEEKKTIECEVVQFLWSVNQVSLN
jgi:Fe-S cluster biosynthesis and repair protein YggX